jgi:hypothetical protein
MVTQANLRETICPPGWTRAHRRVSAARRRHVLAAYGEKDVIEVRLHREVCAGRRTLAEAQAVIASRLLELYQRTMHLGRASASQRR